MSSQLLQNEEVCTCMKQISKNDKWVAMGSQFLEELMKNCRETSNNLKKNCELRRNFLSRDASKLSLALEKGGNRSTVMVRHSPSLHTQQFLKELTKNCTKISNNFLEKLRRNQEEILEVFRAFLKICAWALQSLMQHRGNLETWPSLVRKVALRVLHFQPLFPQGCTSTESLEKLVRAVPVSTLDLQCSWVVNRLIIVGSLHNKAVY